MVADTNDTDNPQHSVSIPDQTEEPRQAEVTPVNNGKAKQPHLEVSVCISRYKLYFTESFHVILTPRVFPYVGSQRDLS